MSVGPLWTKLSEIANKIQNYSFKKMQLKVSPDKRRPFCYILYMPAGSEAQRKYVDCLAKEGHLQFNLRIHVWNEWGPKNIHQWFITIDTKKSRPSCTPHNMDSFMLYLDSLLGYSTGAFQALWCLVPWILTCCLLYVSPLWRKSSFKFHIMENNVFIFSFMYLHIYQCLTVRWHFTFIYLIFTCQTELYIWKVPRYSPVT